MASLHKRKDTNTYYISYRINGKQFKKGLGKVSREIALKAMRKLEDNLDLKKLGLQVPNKTTLKDFSKSYLEWVKNNQANNTLESKKVSIDHFKKFLSKTTKYQADFFELHEITQELIEGFKGCRLRSGAKNRTINIELNCISHLLRIAKEWGYVVSESKIKKLKETQKLPRFFSEQEIQLLLPESSSYLKQIIIISLNTGMRIGEVMNLRWKHIDLDANIIHVSNTESFKTKNGKDRQIQINSNLRNYLIQNQNYFITPSSDQIALREAHQKEYVICHEDGSPIAKPTKAFKNLLARLGINDASLHTLRHTFASQLVMKGVSLPTVKEFLGHQDIKTTMIYVHLSENHKKDAIEQLCSVTDFIPKNVFSILKVA